VCKTEIECQQHILQCSGCKSRELIRKNYIYALRTFFESSGTNATTSRVIVAHLHAWLTNNHPPGIDKIAPEASIGLINATKNQNQIGWDQWFNGCITKLWGEIYNHDLSRKKIYYKTTDRQEI
jgi:hypothetical protein